ncbi:hypothetical protein LCGC14_0876890 [marine sediment metagenome]|uniref:Schlafen AlbA-2 domain-containing protein n=1 Tax=marine sediment metagenome TaxID=412755 RepID=A0A0F9RMQ5_9ZZZZ
MQLLNVGNDIDDFCAQRIKEGFHLEYKADFSDRLKRVICAFANTWGGTILIGVGEDEEGRPKAPVKGIPFKKGLDTRVTSIIVDNIYPPVFCDKYVVTFNRNGTDRAVVVIQVPQSDMTPHALNDREDVYIRTDDRNKLERRANIERIEWLLDRRRKSAELKQRIYLDATDRLETIYKRPHLWWDKEKDAPHSPKFALATFSAVPSFPYILDTSVDVISNLCRSKSLCSYDYHGVVHGDFPELYSQKITQESVIDYHYTERGNGLRYCEFSMYGLFLYQEPLLWHTQQGGVSTGIISCLHVIGRLDQFLEVARKFYDEINVWGLIDLRLKIDNIFGNTISLHDDWSFDEGRISHQPDLDVKRSVYKDELKTKRVDILKGIIQEFCFTFNTKVTDNAVETYLKRYGRLDIFEGNTDSSRA